MNSVDGSSTKVLVFLVAYNEEKTIGELIGEIREKVDLGGLPWEILVVDDGSRDRTGAAARGRGVRVIRHPVNLGIGAAEQTGLLFARRSGYDIAVRMDGDGQHPPEAVGSLVREVAGGAAQLAVGSRFVDRRTGGFRSTLLRRIGIGYFSLLCLFLTGRRVKDPTSGLRCFGRESIELLTRLPASDYPEVESFMDAAGSGLAVKEVPVSFRSRKSGASSIRFFQSIYFMVKVSMAIMVSALRGRP
jgi:glycosyltransferase involved in cell wall biosynthesis